MSNEDEQIRQEILEAFEFEIEPEITEEAIVTFYTIKPKEDGEQNGDKILIKKIKNDEIFNRYNLSFENCKFECEIFLRHKTFNKALRFGRCIFEKFVNFNFSDSRNSFNGDFICQDTIFEDIAYFIKIDFNGKVDFSRSRFKERAFFSHSIFKKAYFKEVIFDNNAYFDEAKFLGEANFSSSEFCQNAHFYKTKFRKIQKGNMIINDIPDFLQAIFNGGINLTNTKLGLTFELVEDKIKETYRKKLREREEWEDIQRLHEVANEFRNVFKNIKDGLIRGSNLLDASQFHKMELYAKELELKYKKEYAKESNIRNFVDKIQLMCYRLTSDHHTDLMLILNNIVFLIAFFGVTSLILNLYSSGLGFEAVIASVVAEASKIKFGTIFIINLSVVLIICFVVVCFKRLICAIVSISICVTIICVYCPIFAFIIASMLCGFFLILTLLTCILRCLKVCITEVKKCTFYFSYSIVTIMLFFKPSLILPVLGKLIENKNPKSCCCVDDFDIFEICLDTVPFASETLNLIYMLFLFLLLWSLQKTARKNTIILS